MYLYGASGHAKVIIDILKSNNIIIHKVFDDNDHITNLLGIEVSLPNREIESVKLPFILSIGNNKTREIIANRYLGLNYTNAIHSSSIIDETVTIKEGVVVMAGVVINSSVKIGRHSIVNTSATIDHDCILCDFVHISPNATLCGNVIIGKGSQVGAGAVIIQGVTIGQNVIIGAGSVVIDDVPDNVIVVGSPGKVIKEIY